MKESDVKIGNVYTAKVSDRVVPVRIDGKHSRKGWNATNTKTGKRVHIKSAQRLRREARVEDFDDPMAAADFEKKQRSQRAAKSPAVNPTVEVVTGQPVPADEPAAPAKKRRAKPTQPANKRRAKAPVEPKPKRTSALDAAAQVLAEAGQPMRAKELIAAMTERSLWSSPNGKTPEATLYAAMIREIATKGDAARFRKVERGQFVAAGREG